MITSEVISFFTVLIVAVGVASIIAFLYAMGVRLWYQGATVDASGSPHILTRVGSVLCFTACVFIVLFALWLMIPIFH